MSITVTEKERFFSLKTANSEYQMQADSYGVLKHLWYGKIVHQNMGYLLEYPDVGFAGNLYEAGNQRTYSLNTMPLEYAGAGVGDFRICAASAVHADGSRALDLRYERYTIRKGKYNIPGLPAVYASDNEAETLEITLRDTASSLSVTLRYGVLPELDIITRSVLFQNNGTTPIVLQKAASLCLDLPQSDSWDWIHFHGRHAMERLTERTALMHGIQESSSTRGTSSHQQNPSVILCEPDCTESSGACIGAFLLYSGSFQTQIEVDQLRQTRLVMGLHPDLFQWTLQPNDTFATPEAVLSYSSNGLAQLSHHFHQVIREHICRGTYQLAERPILINSWEAAYFDFDDQKLLKIAKEAAAIGVDMLVLDDGWFGKRDDDCSGLGDWFVNEKKLNGSLCHLVEQVKAMGLKFGIWFEPEMVSEDSDLYRAHPEWSIQIPGRKPTRSRYQLLLDLSRSDVQDYLYERISAILKEADISYIKWDMNRSICDWYTTLLPADQQGELPHRYILGLYALLERLTTDFPEVLFEGCSGGGGRFDAGMLYYCPQIWCSDDTDAYERTKIQYGTSFIYPISAVGSHISIVPNHQTGRITPMETRGITAMAGSFGLELDLEKLSPEEKAEAAAQIQNFRTYGSLIHNGNYYRLNNPFTENGAFWSFVAKDGTEILVQGMIFRTEPNMNRKSLHLTGLDPDAIYQDTESGIRYTGASLMSGGLLLPQTWGDYYPVSYFLKRV